MSSSSSHKKMKIADPYPNERKDWSGLPRDLLFDIMDRLTVIEDYVRFGAVCRSWRTIFVKENPENTNRHCSQPLIFLKSRTPRKCKARIYSLSTYRKYKNFNFDWPWNKSFQASSFGWLLSTTNNHGSGNCKVQLQNPFLSEDYIFDLPLINHIFKTVLSSDPSFSRCFVVVAITIRGLNFCKPGDSAWTPIKNGGDNSGFCDVVFFNKTKQFYALRYDGQVLAIDFEREPTLVQVMPPDKRFRNLGRSYLVEDMSGDLLVVVSNIPSRAMYFRLEVFKLDLVQGKGTKVHDLGDSVWFMSNNGVIARPLSDCPGCERNCIYVTESVIWNPCNHGPCLGIYNLKDRTTQARNIGFPPKVPRHIWIWSELIWLEPTLLRSVNGA